MITSIQLKDFIAHRDTRLDFGKGITIFVGHNGSGKSSIIDAVTFALFGKHTRKSVKNLVRRGGNSAMVQMRFTLNSKEFQATRGLNGPGSQPFSQFVIVSEGGNAVNKPIVGGERKQFGESMSAEVAKVLGMDYEKLRVAAVVQQGELVKIVEAQPKEFKELLNGLIGIDRLDFAYETMREVITGFRERLRDETGYTDQDISRLEKTITEKEQELQQASGLLAEYEEEKKLLDGKIVSLEKEIERLEPLTRQVQELQNCEKLLIRHVTEKRELLVKEVVRFEKVVQEAGNCLAILSGKEETQIRLQMVKAEAEELQARLQDNEGIMGKLQGFLECSGRMKITDGRCPVCNSNVTKLNEMFDTAHIQQEIKQRMEEKSKILATKLQLRKEEQELLDLDKKIAAAEKFLANNSVASDNDLVKIKDELMSKKKDLDRLGTADKLEDPSKFTIDSTSKSLGEQIILLRSQVKGFSQQQHVNAKLERMGLLQKVQSMSSKIGEYQRVIRDAQAAIDTGRSVVDQLNRATEFVGTLEKIRSVIFNRDGTVGVSLRSWALSVISAKASEYASLFNIGISRIELSEKARDITITCYGRQGEIDLDSLSGGEKVAVALALRLGIAYMMGSNKLDFIILDEPTTHLDEERRKALVQIISDAFREGAGGPLSQMIIITHDSEIFENAEVDKIYQFAMTTDGSKVSLK